MGARRIRVMVVGGSLPMSRRLADMLGLDRRLNVVGAVASPDEVRDDMLAYGPDVVVLNVEMQRGDALRLVKMLADWRPIPVLMVAANGESNPSTMVRAPAVDCFEMPAAELACTFHDTASELARRVIDAVAAGGQGVRVADSGSGVGSIVAAVADHEPSPRVQGHGDADPGGTLIAIGASTGGTEAINAILSTLPPRMPGIVITQHIPAYFSMLFAQRMNKNSMLRVHEADDGQAILPGHVYIAPGDRHLLIRRNGDGYVCRLQCGPTVNRHRPSVDVLFDSVAGVAGENAIGVLLTGMGRDGAEGLLELRRKGASTMVQDEASSVVWGMPGEAVKRGAADVILALEGIAGRLVALSRERNARRAIAAFQ